MSKLHKESIPRISNPGNDEGFISLFEALAAEAEESQSEVGQVCMPYIEEGDEFVPGTWVPELWLVVRKVRND